MSYPVGKVPVTMTLDDTFASRADGDTPVTTGDGTTGTTMIGDPRTSSANWTARAGARAVSAGIVQTTSVGVASVAAPIDVPFNRQATDPTALNR